jgi:hypothetical protein
MLWGILIVYLESRDAGCCYGTTVQEYMPAVDYEVEQQDYRNSSSSNNNNNLSDKSNKTTSNHQSQQKRKESINSSEKELSDF